MTVRMTQVQSACLALACVTGGWAIPERGGLWRGADGTRLHLSGRPVKGRTAWEGLLRRGLVEKRRLSEMGAFARPDWIPDDGWFYHVTDAGREACPTTSQSVP